eukprot:SAG31_NODE_3454_length_4253_cov_2.613866_3_plen_489_part_00
MLSTKLLLQSIVIYSLQTTQHHRVRGQHHKLKIDDETTDHGMFVSELSEAMAEMLSMRTASEDERAFSPGAFSQVPDRGSDATSVQLWLARNAQRLNVNSSVPNGVQYRIVPTANSEQGKGSGENLALRDVVTKGGKCTALYSARFVDRETPFSSSSDGNPIEFDWNGLFGERQQQQAWAKVVVDMQLGDVWEVFVPSSAIVLPSLLPIPRDLFRFDDETGAAVIPGHILAYTIEVVECTVAGQATAVMGSRIESAVGENIVLSMFTVRIAFFTVITAIGFGGRLVKRLAAAAAACTKVRKNTTWSSDDMSQNGSRGAVPGVFVDLATIRRDENPRVYLEIAIGMVQRARRLEIELFPALAPVAVANFRCLCTGEKGMCTDRRSRLHYAGSDFHRVVPDFIAQAGDFTRRNGLWFFSPSNLYSAPHRLYNPLVVCTQALEVNQSMVLVSTMSCLVCHWIVTRLVHIVGLELSAWQMQASRTPTPPNSS